MVIMADKKWALEKIAREIRNCSECKTGTSGKAVPGEGNPDADIVFLGEAPGKKEAATGRPFIGRSGQLLRKLIRETGLSDDEVYITSPVKYLPDRGTPSKKQIAHGLTHLNKQLTVINPEIIVLLGNTASYALFGKTVQILKNHGKIEKFNGRNYLYTLHPAAAIRFPIYRELLTEDFRKLKFLVRHH